MKPAPTPYPTPLGTQRTQGTPALMDISILLSNNIFGIIIRALQDINFSLFYEGGKDTPGYACTYVKSKMKR